MKKTIWIITLFPDVFTSYFSQGVLGKALTGERNLEGTDLKVKVLNLRDYSNNNYKGVDDSPYGGGSGMVMRADILKNALKAGLCENDEQKFGDLKKNFLVIFPAPRGVVWNTQIAKDFALNKIASDSRDLVFICGRYEGIDERFLELYVDEFYSVGDYILTGGELAVMCMMDSAMRFVPGMLGNKLSCIDESFSDGLLEYPQYTKPRDFQGMKVPEVLLSGHHQNILEYQNEQKQKLTQKYRPDLWKKYHE